MDEKPLCTFRITPDDIKRLEQGLVASRTFGKNEQGFATIGVFLGSADAIEAVKKSKELIGVRAELVFIELTKDDLKKIRNDKYENHIRGDGLVYLSKCHFDNFDVGLIREDLAQKILDSKRKMPKK